MQRELDALPAQIEQWEAELLELSNQMAQPEFYNRSPEAIAAASQQIADKEAALQVAYQRWDEWKISKGNSAVLLNLVLGVQHNLISISCSGYLQWQPF